MNIEDLSKLVESKRKSTNVNEDVNSTSIKNLIPITMFMIGQIHIWHLLCTSGQKHLALGNFYDALVEGIDELSENYIALNGIIESDSYTYNVRYNEKSILDSVQKYRDLVTMCISQTNDSEYLSLQDSLIDIQEKIDSFVYQFNLN